MQLYKSNKIHVLPMLELSSSVDRADLERTKLEHQPRLASAQLKLVFESTKTGAELKTSYGSLSLASLVACVDQSNKILPYHLMTEREIIYIAYFAGSKLWIR